MAAAVQIIAEQAVRFGENLRERAEAQLTPAEALLIFAAHLEVLARDIERDEMLGLEVSRLGALTSEVNGHNELKSIARSIAAEVPSRNDKFPSCPFGASCGSVPPGRAGSILDLKLTVEDVVEMLINCLDQLDDTDGDLGIDDFVGVAGGARYPGTPEDAEP